MGASVTTPNQRPHTMVAPGLKSARTAVVANTAQDAAAGMINGFLMILGMPRLQPRRHGLRHIHP